MARLRSASVYSKFAAASICPILLLSDRSVQQPFHICATRVLGDDTLVSDVVDPFWQAASNREVTIDSSSSRRPAPSGAGLIAPIDPWPRSRHRSDQPWPPHRLAPRMAASLFLQHPPVRAGAIIAPGPQRSTLTTVSASPGRPSLSLSLSLNLCPACAGDHHPSWAASTSPGRPHHSFHPWPGSARRRRRPCAVRACSGPSAPAGPSFVSAAITRPGTGTPVPPATAGALSARRSMLSTVERRSPAEVSACTRPSGHTSESWLPRRQRSLRAALA